MANARAPEFEIDGSSLALDFVNTWEDRGRPETDKLCSYRDLLAFTGQAGLLDRRQIGILAGLAGNDDDAARALARSLELREVLYRLFAGCAAGAAADPHDLERLSGAVAHPEARRTLEPAGNSFAWRWHGLADALEAPLDPIAQAASELLTSAELGRVRECDGSDCTWLFLDSSRNRSRRWCSMESCGNRAKARRHYRRARAVKDAG